MRPCLSSALLLALVLAPGAGADDAPSPGTPGAEACARSAVRAVQQRYEKVRDFEARFEQTTLSVAFGRAGESRSSRGRMVLQKPGRMRWHYQEPEESLVVSDGEWLWIYDPELREAQKLPVSGGWLSGAGVQFLLGEGDLTRDFDVAAASCDAGSARLVLRPRAEATYETLVLDVDPASGEVRSTEVRDLLGNVTKIAFLETRFDTAPDASLFRFEPPEGVEVVELTPPPGAPE